MSPSPHFPSFAMILTRRSPDVHMFERYASVPIAIIFLIILGKAGSSLVSNGFGGTGPEEAGSVLSFGAAVAGFGLGWSSLAADYTVNFPVETPSWKVFAYTYAGLNVPLVLVESLGAAISTAYPEADGLAGLLRAPLESLGGFASFLIVVLALSVVANNIPNMYSFALSTSLSCLRVGITLTRWCSFPSAWKVRAEYP